MTRPASRWVCARLRGRQPILRTALCLSVAQPWYSSAASACTPRDGIARSGGMAEWLKAHAWKACIRETVSWVRIPLPPPDWHPCLCWEFLGDALQDAINRSDVRPAYLGERMGLN